MYSAALCLMGCMEFQLKIGPPALAILSVLVVILWLCYLGGRPSDIRLPWLQVLLKWPSRRTGLDQAGPSDDEDALHTPQEIRQPADYDDRPKP
jgi:hypothetical protein